MERYCVAIDQGTTSSRVIVFDHGGRVRTVAQTDHRQIYPRPGWVEHDPRELLANCRELLERALADAGAGREQITGLGITSQRETTVVWDRESGEPVYNAIVWQDTRTDAIVAELAAEHRGVPASGGSNAPATGGSNAPATGTSGDVGKQMCSYDTFPSPREDGGRDATGVAGGLDRFRERTGLPLATYFSGPKVRWILDNVPGARARADAGELLFGTIDSWLIWNLTGGLHLTDATNASRTLLMDLRTLAWDPSLADAIGVPLAMLPTIRSSSEVYGEVRSGAMAGVPIAGDLGDQQAAMFGQACFAPGEAKNTYGTGNFMLINTGPEPVRSRSGLLSTVCYRLDGQRPVYALEGSIAVTGSLVQWLRDNLGLISDAAEIEQLAGTVKDNGDVYIVPAFSGLFAPYWRADARGAILGLTRYVNKGHIARAALEATAFQTAEIVEAMRADSGVELEALKVDGGMVANQTLMQFQADILGVPVVRPAVAETTALGAAYAAGLATGFWAGLDELRSNWAQDAHWLPQMDATTRAERMRRWKKAVTRTFDWVDQEVD